MRRAQVPGAETLLKPGEELGHVEMSFDDVVQVIAARHIYIYIYVYIHLHLYI